jgi:flagellar motor switch/type III secretory pathway protein FliN
MTVPFATIVSAQAARPLRHWSTVQLQAAQRAVEGIWREWATRWQLTIHGVVALNACDAATTMEPCAWTRSGAMWATAGAQQPAEILAALLFGEGSQADPRSPVARAVVAEAAADLSQRLGRIGTGKSNVAGDEPPAKDGHRWSGAIRIRLELAHGTRRATWQLHCSEALAALLCGGVQAGAAAGRPALTQVADAIAGQALRFQVCLDETTVTLGTLQSLRVGDVLPLSHRLDQPLRVATHGASSPTSPFCAAYLGSRDHHRAVELVPAAPSSHQIAS